MYDHKHQQNGPASSSNPEGYNINNHKPNDFIYLFYTWNTIAASNCLQP